MYRDGKVIYSKGYGLANIEESVPITPNTVFDVGSLAKQFTAASILLLEKQGKLRLDDDIRKYIPELPDYSQYGGQKITLLQLLNHTSGLRDYVSLFLLEGIHYDNVTTIDDALRIIARQKGLNFTPGSNWEYTGSGYLLLSVVVQRVSGKTLKQFAAENIFRPLGMLHTQFRNDHTLLMPHRALGYDRNDKAEYVLSVSYGEEIGDGMLHTSIEDLQKWDGNVYCGQVGGRDLVMELQERARLNDGTIIDYGKGVVPDHYRGLNVIWHGGASAGYRAYFVQVPQRHLSVACLCNLASATPWERAKRVVDLFLTGIPDKEKTASEAHLSTEQVNGAPGVYRNSQNGDVLRVSLNQGKLQADLGEGMRELHPTNAKLFQLLDHRPFSTLLKFDPPSGQKNRKFVVNTARELPSVFEAVQVPNFTSPELSDYVGDYWSEELHVTYRLSLKNDAVWLDSLIGADGLIHHDIIPFADLRPVVRDEFDLNGAPLVFRFMRQNGNINGFLLNGFRERGILFSRR